MQAAESNNPLVEEAIQAVLADESSATQLCIASNRIDSPPLTVTDAQRIMECLQNNPRISTLEICRCRIVHDDTTAAVLNVFRDGLALCSAVTKVRFSAMQLGIEGLNRLKSDFYNTSITVRTRYWR
jgi:hypothetical protein